jgi:hypothetical protein
VKPSEIRLSTNIICRKIWDEEGREIAFVCDSEIAPRLTYWELYGLYEALPDRFSHAYLIPSKLNPVQKAQVKALYQEDNFWPEAEQYAPLHKSLPSEEPPEFPSMWPASAEEISRLFFDQEVAADSVTDDYQPESDIESISSGKATGLPVVTDALIDEPSQSYDVEPEILEESIDFQTSFIEDSLKNSHLVFAPPGTGKTHALIKRIVHILTNENLVEPTSELVVLSFSRAAVREIRKRVYDEYTGGASGDFEYITVRTFDSFASQKIFLDYSSDDLSQYLGMLEGSSYEKRIQFFTTSLGTEKLASGTESVDRIRYLFIDEIQDLCTYRARMVNKIISRVLDNGGCVSLLGDPAQGIYDYQAKEEGPTSREFLRSLTEKYGQNLTPFKFKKYFRYQDDCMLSFVQGVTAAVGNGDEPQSRIMESIVNDYCRRFEPDEIKDQIEAGGTTAILTRKNIETLQLADYCRRERIPYTLHRGVGGKRWPGWLARVFYRFKQDKMTDTMFCRRWDDFVKDKAAIDSGRALDLLDDERIIRDGVIDIINLNRRIISEELPESWQENEDKKNSVVISNIHKSKGLEFDNVLVLEPSKDTLFKSDEESRVFYVAVTRATEKLNLLKRNDWMFKSRQLTKGIYEWKSVNTRGIFLDGDNSWDLFSIIESVVGNNISKESLDKRFDTLWDYYCSEQGDQHGFLLAEESDGRYWLIAQCGPDRVPIQRVVWGLDRKLAKIKDKVRYENDADRVGLLLDISGLETFAVDLNDHNQRLLGNACLVLKPVISERVIIQEG